MNISKNILTGEIGNNLLAINEQGSEMVHPSFVPIKDQSTFKVLSRAKLSGYNDLVFLKAGRETKGGGAMPIDGSLSRGTSSRARHWQQRCNPHRTLVSRPLKRPSNTPLIKVVLLANHRSLLVSSPIEFSPAFKPLSQSVQGKECDFSHRRDTLRPPMPTNQIEVRLYSRAPLIFPTNRITPPHVGSLRHNYQLSRDNFEAPPPYLSLGLHWFHSRLLPDL